jgi:hypothetical protein
MGYRTLLALGLALVSGPVAVSAQSGPAPGGVPTLALQPPPAVHRPVPVHSGERRFFAPRPRGWVWGGPGWWGGSYQPPMPGYILPSYWLSPTYVVPDWDAYGFGEPGYGRRWVRYYDDAVLVDGRGMIYDSISDVPWGRGPVPAYAGNAPDMAPPYGAGYDYDDEVTWNGGVAHSDRQIWAWPSHVTTAAGGNTVIVVPPGSTTTITFQPQTVVTTTTTTYREDAHPRARPVWKERPRIKEEPRSNPPRVIGRVPVTKG